ncbi:uncharacterized protein F4822DRAFT_400063 [Hypoxylon trugodes]|uniref:uncharacterized protein n=1 Tax=Hypoxylon trugodes TaxID=326681 RepID=UPI002195F4CC|nr:uncharacterized protein F4822DRAFT_400063 [Hypoxylon trugodes]KAI1389870.1 hypothetical protein F4822DRAFT_400063 [Hypoxylon trugodes]
MAPQKPRCTFKECKSAAQRIVGDCGFCDGHFCAKHRLLEDHKCSGLEDVSMCPTPSTVTSDSSIDDAAEWWLVGLGEYLDESGILEESCGSHMLTQNPNRSARKNRTNATQHSSRRNERKSSGVYKKRNTRTHRPTATCPRRLGWCHPRHHDRVLRSTKYTT